MKQQRTKSLYLDTIAVAQLSALSIVGCASLRDANTAEPASRSLADVTHASVTAAKAGRSPPVALVPGAAGCAGSPSWACCMRWRKPDQVSESTGM